MLNEKSIKGMYTLIKFQQFHFIFSTKRTKVHLKTANHLKTWIR